MFRSRFLFVVLALFVLAFSATAQDQVVLRIWGEPGTGCQLDPENPWEFCFYSRNLVDAFQAEYPNIRLEFEDHGWDADLYQALQTSIEEGTAPDITIGESFLPQMVRAGQLLPLDLPEDARANIIPATVAYVQDGEDLYGVSVFTGIFALELNKDVFLEAGYVPEQFDLASWDGVLEAATEITEEGSGDFYGFSILGPTPLPAAALFRAVPYLYMTGADLCNMPECTEPTFNDPRGIAFYEWIRALYQVSDPELVMNGDEGNVFSQLFTGYTAMQTAGSWHPSWSSSLGCEQCVYYPLPLPAVEDAQASNVVVGNAIYSVLSTTEHAEEAMLFMEFVTRDEVQNGVLVTGTTGRLPTTYSAAENILAWANGESLDAVPEFFTTGLGHELEDVSNIAVTYETFVHELLSENVRTLPFIKSDVAALWNEMFAEVLQSDRPIEEILDDYQARAEDLMGS